MIVRPSQISDYLLRSQSLPEYAVRYRDTGGLAFSATPHALIVLASRGYIEGNVYKHNLISCRLLVPAGVAQRILSPMMARVGSGITRRRQGRGAKQWIQRQDQAHGGQMGGMDRIWFQRQAA